ncbi:MAG: pyridoxamine 5'-phosphate oxidase family protein [Sporolactobacillus sp.]
MRISELECTDEGKINALLIEGRVGYLGLFDKEYPYVVPLNYVWLDGKIYFHGADAGKKAELMGADAHCSFTVCKEYGTISHPVPARTDTAYISVMIFGKVTQVAEWDESTHVMQALLDKYVPGYYDRGLARSHVEKYRSSHGSVTAVYCVRPDTISAKEKPLDQTLEFVPGKTAAGDLQRFKAMS